MQILLLGNKGQIGQEIEQLANAQNIKIFGFDLPHLDITSINQLDHTFKQYTNINCVINAAAYTNVEQAEDEANQAYEVNAKGAENLAFICHKYNLPLLHLSTDYVFSGEKIGAYSEMDATNPLGIYGKSKLAGDQAIVKVWQKHIILRVSWIFGIYGNNFVKKMLQLAQEREVINVVGDQFGCPTTAADVARVLLEIATKLSLGQKSWGIYNYCGYPVTTWYDFAKKIIELAANRCPLKVKQLNNVTTEQFTAKAKRPKNSELLVRKIYNNYGIVRKNWNVSLVEVINSLTL